jgi:hypothetical protein
VRLPGLVSGAEENGRLSSFSVSQLPSVQHLITDFVNTLKMAFARGDSVPL